MCPCHDFVKRRPVTFFSLLCPLRCGAHGDAFRRHAPARRCEVILAAGAVAPRGDVCRMGFPSHWRSRRHAAPPSHPFPCETLVFIAQVVTASLLSLSAALGSSEGCSASSPAAAGMQVCTPTCLLPLPLGWRIAPLPCPTGANSPMLRRPQSPRAFRVPLWHSDSGSSVKHPLPLRRNVMQRVTLSLDGLRRHPQRRLRGVSHGPDNRLQPQCECGYALKHPPAPLCPHALTGAQTAYCAGLVLCSGRRGGLCGWPDFTFVGLWLRTVARVRVGSVCVRVGAAPLGDKKLASCHEYGRARARRTRRASVGEYDTNPSPRPPTLTRVLECV